MGNGCQKHNWAQTPDCYKNDVKNGETKTVDKQWVNLKVMILKIIDFLILKKA